MFVIIDSNHWDIIDFDECNESGLIDCKISIDCTKAIISYKDEQPSFCFDITNDDIGLQEYTSQEILQLVQGTEWKPIG